MAGNDWFPLYGDRLMRSKWWRRASDTARARNVMLWWRAFKEVPAGSLPDDDDDLAEAAGYGFDVEAFLAVKAEVMSAWTLCADGRWYHPTVCEVVLDTWERAGERRRKAAEKKRQQRERVRCVPEQTANVPGGAQPVPRDIATHNRHNRQDSKDADASLSPLGDEPQFVLTAEPIASALAEAPTKYPPAFETAWKAYPHCKGRSSKPKALGFWRRLPAATRDALPTACARYAREGREPRQDCGAPAMQRWLSEARFEDWLAPSSPSASGTTRPAWSGPPALRAAVVSRMGEAWAVGWLDPTRYQDVPVKALLVSKRIALARLRDEVGSILAEHGVELRLQESAA